MLGYYLSPLPPNQPLRTYTQESTARDLSSASMTTEREEEVQKGKQRVKEKRREREGEVGRPKGTY